jgi:hypothetical protein
MRNKRKEARKAAEEAYADWEQAAAKANPHDVEVTETKVRKAAEDLKETSGSSMASRLLKGLGKRRKHNQQPQGLIAEFGLPESIASSNFRTTRCTTRSI